MLKKFEIEGFKSFENKFTLDLSKANNSDYNREIVDNGIIRVCSIFGKNSSGKSNLGLALLDAMNHLTDSREKTLIAANPYLNLDRNDFTEFTYYFSFGNDDIIYNYRKVAVDELLYEKVDINGNIAIEYDYIEKKGYCNLKGRGLSITKYIRNNSVLEDNEENRAFKKFYNYIENMILINSFDLNRCFGCECRGELIESYIVKSGKLKDFESFLQSLDIKCNLESVNLDGREIILNKFKKGSMRFFETAPVGIRSLAMIYYCLVSDIDESVIFVDALDVYDCELAEKIVREMVKRKPSSQIMFTSHNTNLMTNELLCDRLLLDKYHETIKF